MAAFFSRPRTLAIFGVGTFAVALWMALSPISNAGQRPVLMIMSALPLDWRGADIGAVVQGNAERSPLSIWLDHFFEVKTLDRLAPETLSGRKTLLLAQPRRLAPEELVALDEWVRDGGNVLILDDPELHWTDGSAPQTSLLDPLLTHWGIRLELPVPNQGQNRELSPLGSGGGDGIGSWTPEKPECGVAMNRVMGSCQIGAGKAHLIADADWIAPAQWHAGGNVLRPVGHISDNAGVFVDIIDRVSGLTPRHVGKRVALHAERGFALAGASFFILLGALTLALARVIRKRKAAVIC